LYKEGPNKIKVEDPAIVISSKTSVGLTLQKGIVVANDGYIQSAIPLVTTDEGSPLFDQNGNVIGMNTAKQVNSSISLAILMLIKMFNISFIIFKINNFIMFILGLSIFVEFIYRKEFYNKTINYISSSILGIYLIHDNFILRPIIWGKVNIGAHIEKSYFWFYEIGVVLFIFCSCLIIDKIRIKFIETPVLKFIYKKIDNKKEENINKELVKN